MAIRDKKGHLLGIEVGKIRKKAIIANRDDGHDGRSLVPGMRLKTECGIYEVKKIKHRRNFAVVTIKKV